MIFILKRLFNHITRNNAFYFPWYFLRRKCINFLLTAFPSSNWHSLSQPPLFFICMQKKGVGAWNNYWLWWFFLSFSKPGWLGRENLDFLNLKWKRNSDRHILRSNTHLVASKGSLCVCVLGRWWWEVGVL